MPRTSCRTRRDRLVIAPAGGWQDGGIGAVQASFNHPFLELLVSDTFCQQQRALSSRVATTLRSMAHAGKYRPCLIVSRRRHRQVYLMGTLEGKSRLMVDQFTQDFMIPIAPTHVKGSFQLVVNPPGLEMPCWVNGLPLKAGFDKLSGYWTSQTESTGEVKYQAEKSQVDDFLLACAEQQERFRALNEQNPQLKTDMIRQFLDYMEAFNSNCVTSGQCSLKFSVQARNNRTGRRNSRISTNSRAKRAPRPVLDSVVDFPPLAPVNG